MGAWEHGSMGAWELGSPVGPLHLGRAVRKEIARKAGAVGVKPCWVTAQIIPPWAGMGRRQPSATATTSHQVRTTSCNLLPPTMPRQRVRDRTVRDRRCGESSPVSSLRVPSVEYMYRPVHVLYIHTVQRTYLSASPLPAPCPAKTRFIRLGSGSDSSHTPMAVNHLGCQGARPRPHRGQCRVDHPVQDIVRPFRPTQPSF
jgi:hypothetical protein